MLNLNGVLFSSSLCLRFGLLLGREQRGDDQANEAQGDQAGRQARAQQMHQTVDPRRGARPGKDQPRRLELGPVLPGPARRPPCQPGPAL